MNTRVKTEKRSTGMVKQQAGTKSNEFLFSVYWQFYATLVVRSGFSQTQIRKR